MPPRRSHQKSRRGCLACKVAHVKCNEAGPPCGRCELRATTCEYTSPGPGLQQPQDLSSGHGPPIQPAGPSPELQPLEEPLFPNEVRVLELQLMHRWSTVTYKSLYSKVAGDDYIWQTAVPRWSLQHDFLCAGLFALSAFEAASCCSSSSGTGRAKYLRAAVEYQTVALNNFRRHLQHQETNPESYEIVLCFSLMLMVLALASSQFMSELAGDASQGDGDSMVLNTLTHFELLRGCGTVLGANAEQYLAQNSYVQKLTLFENLPRLPFDSETAAAMSKLNTANERRIISTVGESYEHRVQQVAHFEACKKAISLLEECFAKCVGVGQDDDDYQGYILGWLNMAGEEYVNAIKGNDHVALLVLMCWGALVEKLGRRVWWAKDFGRLLVEEISEMTLNQTADGLTTDLISSARRLMDQR
ncbi:uncharacterized protein Z520_09896 [Fonsecaea multimorphosa CBS 102226]|uniref:Zn(2)-C6 fungal-type domain-containing protein n=1 Tax=Fonsecaea multimorphosa CBS 102226 TaxID=1442371 RepID=A0A0D2GY82_9EURO|nr:uncharacterized protein Z520_09896 [Fonsecaea multimorphosa CBS 102226]KIX94510.1 hypothetical protein Z520_09896 [Fonsecaea multimorphosa CBS 102226]OAL20088.1 hypothetical protein AYO22_09238 [Fonsecaea multimorphosa]